MSFILVLSTLVLVLTSVYMGLVVVVAWCYSGSMNQKLDRALGREKRFFIPWPVFIAFLVSLASVVAYLSGGKFF